MDRLSHDILIVGGGAAGLRAALAATEVDRKLDVAVVSKVYPMRSHTVSAEGGTAAVLKDYDNFDSHAFDTIKGSDYLADQDAVEFFVHRCPAEIIRMEHWGCPWSREPDGHLAQRAFGGMSVKRTVFAADKVGFHMLHTLFQETLRHDNIGRHDEWFVTSIVADGGRVHGVTAIDLHTGEFAAITARAIIIATGGAGRVYPFTTNGFIKTGDGMAMGYRAGVPLKDMEFVQYHPTGLPGTGILITEAARGEGGYLVNREGERFMKTYAPTKMELGPRDILSRSIMQEIQAGRAFEGPYGAYVGLDLRHLGEEVINRKLPMVRELVERYVGIDPVRELIPVRPVVHYFMGGVATDVHGRTAVAGLYAAGEAACVSINGANRLGSNSLSECLVFGAEAGREAAEFALDRTANPPEVETLQREESRIFGGILGRERGEEHVAAIRRDLQNSMEEHAGIYREEAKLKEGIQLLRDLRRRFGDLAVADKDRVFNTELTAALELDFMLDVAEAITHSALRRRESRGAHTRTDYPKRDDANFLTHSLAHWGPEGPRIDYAPATVTRWQPQERVY